MKRRIVFILFYAAMGMASCKSTVSALKREKDMKAYLMVYFKDETHSLHMALSSDGCSFTDVNSGNPVIAGDTISEQKGIRDPYICRGPDGSFYMALTDLHISAQKEGYRSSKWQRDEKLYGWGNNRGLVLMRSRDLIHWSHSLLRVDKSFEELSDIGCAWAPEMIFDNAKGKMMLYYTMRFKNGITKMYYAYMDKEFTKFETLPELLFESPDGSPCIDGDIIQVGNKYHLFYVSHQEAGGIKQAVSNTLTGGYQYNPAWVDPEPKACEAPTVFKIIGKDKWVLIYDIFGITPNNLGFSETSDFENFTDLGHFNQGVMKAVNFSSPKHCAVIQITKKEADKLANQWNLKITF